VQNNSILNGSGTYIQTAGSTTIGLGSSFTQRTLQIDLGSFTDYGTVTITGDATNSGSLTIDGASGIMTVDGTYTQTGADASTLLLEGGTFDPPAIDIEGGVFGGAGTVDGPVTLTGDSTLQVGDPTGELELDGDYSQTGGRREGH
jgi:hypothetical protein